MDTLSSLYVCAVLVATWCVIAVAVYQLSLARDDDDDDDDK